MVGASTGPPARLAGPSNQGLVAARELAIHRKGAPTASKEQAKRKVTAEKAVNKSNLRAAIDALYPDRAYGQLLADYKLAKHAGQQASWTKWFMVSWSLDKGSLALKDLLARIDLSWVDARNGGHLATWLGTVDRSDKESVLQAMVDNARADCERMLKIKNVAFELAGAAPEPFQKVMAPLWPTLANRQQAMQQTNISGLLAAGDLARAAAVVAATDTQDLRSMYLFKREKASAEEYIKWLVVLPKARVQALASPAELKEDLRRGPYGWVSTPATAQYVLGYLAQLVEPAALEMLKNVELRQQLTAQAATDFAKLQQAKPVLRITEAAETAVAAQGSGSGGPTLDQVAQAVFDAFLGDLSISQLHYSTNSLDFSPISFLLGTGASKAAPCMSLSSVFGHLLDMWPQQAQMKQVGDDRPLLTKPLAGISTSGTLTRSTTFTGNVNTYRAQQGFDTVNRVFFGDGHIWLELNGKQYDPTLGISGDKGTVEAAVEAFYVKESDNVYENGTLVATRSADPVPPGGDALNFSRSVAIVDTAGDRG
ncbi:hypothetical protein BH20ACT2_BH20ACT2_03750 [soil metagenome]